MPRRLIVCCDGTWNVFGQKHPTNVVKLYQAIAGTDDAGVIQDSVYVAGVGTKPWHKVRGGALGLGLSKNVKKGYLELVDMYEPGDEIFLFGFSRGAYTARSIAGFIRNAGLLSREHRGRLDEAFALYRDRDRSSAPSGERAVEFREQYSHEVPIRFIGVWDTVGSLGIPLSGKLFEWINRRWAFHDTQLSSTVAAAYHALAIDEKRGPFKPTLWRAQPDAGGRPPPARFSDLADVVALPAAACSDHADRVARGASLARPDARGARQPRTARRDSARRGGAVGRPRPHHRVQRLSRADCDDAVGQGPDARRGRTRPAHPARQSARPCRGGRGRTVA